MIWKSVAKPTDFEILYGYLESGETLKPLYTSTNECVCVLLWRTADTIWSIHLWPQSWHVTKCTMFALVYACKDHEELHVYFSIVGSYKVTLLMIYTCGRNSATYKHITVLYHWSSTEGAAHDIHATTKRVWPYCRLSATANDAIWWSASFPGLPTVHFWSLAVVFA